MRTWLGVGVGLRLRLRLGLGLGLGMGLAHVARALARLDLVADDQRVLDRLGGLGEAVDLLLLG